MPINAGHEYFEAEKKYLAAQTLSEKIQTLKELIRTAPKHKGTENLLAELKTRLKKLLTKQEKGKKTGKGQKGIRKEGWQAALIGKTNSGKSALLSKITNAHPKISEQAYTTKQPEIGTMQYEGAKVQIIDMPSVKSKEYDQNITNTADCLIIVVEDVQSIQEIKDYTEKNQNKKIIVLNKIDKLTEQERRKTEATLKTKKINYEMISAKTGERTQNLKQKIFNEMGKIRVYTKEPGKPANKDPVILEKGTTVKEAAETIYKGFAKQIKETRLTGPSGKFSNQRVGLNHKLADKDVIEFKT